MSHMYQLDLTFKVTHHRGKAPTTQVTLRAIDPNVWEKPMTRGCTETLPDLNPTVDAVVKALQDFGYNTVSHAPIPGDILTQSVYHLVTTNSCVFKGTAGNGSPTALNKEAQAWGADVCEQIKQICLEKGQLPFHGITVCVF